MSRIGIVCTAIVLLVPPSVLAQTRRAGLGPYVTLRPRSRIDLLGLPSVQKELKLTAEQQAGIGKALERFQKENQRINQEAQEELRRLGDEPDPEARRASFVRGRASRDALGRETEGALLKTLDRRQRTRFDQVHLRAEGPLVFTRPEMQKRLNLSPAQVEAIASILDEGQGELRRRMDATSQLIADSSTRVPGQSVQKIDPARLGAVKSAMEEARTGGIQALESMDKRIFKLLTKKQRAAYEKMLGEPFALDGFWPAPKAATPESKDKPDGESRKSATDAPPPTQVGR